MAISFDNVFGLHERGLLLRAKRAEIISSNIANADTPGYKAKGMDFQQAMQQAARKLPEYGGVVGDYSPAEVTNLRKLMDETKILLNETLYFKRAFEMPEGQGNRVTGDNQSTNNAKSQILQMRK